MSDTNNLIDFRALAGSINNYQKANQEQVKATQLSSGDIITVWQSFDQDNNGYGIYAQRLDSSGNKIGDEFRINSYVKNNQSNPVITPLSDGGFIIAWQSFDQDGNGYGIYAKKFDSLGAVIGSELQVNNYTKNNQSNPAITLLSDGGYIIAWQSFDQDGNGYDIYAKRLNKSGLIIKEEFQVNSYTKNNQSNPAITLLSDGGYIIAWQSFDQDGKGYGIYAKRFDQSGAVIKEEFQVNSYTKNTQSNPVVTKLSDGGFIIAWQSFDQDGSGYGIYAKEFNAASDQVGEEFQVNNATNNDQIFPTITSLPDGYALAWQSWNQDTSQYDLYMHQYWDNNNDKEIRIMGSNSHSSAQHPIIISLANNGSAIFIESTGIQDKNIIGYISDITPTSTPTQTMTQSITVTPTISPTATASLTSSATANFTPSITPSSSISDSTTGSVTNSSSITPTITSSATATNSEPERISLTNSITSATTHTSSVSNSSTITSSVSVSGTDRPSITDSAMSATQSITMTPIISASSSLRITNTVSVSPTSSIIASSSATKTNTASTSVSSEASATPSYASVPLTVSPSPSAYIVQFVTGGGEYTGTATRDNFVINVNEDTTITGGSGDDIFTILDNQKTNTTITVTITDFDVAQEKIDLSQLPDIKSMDDLTITAGSAIIHLPGQNIRLFQLTPDDLHESNFIFSPPESAYFPVFSTKNIGIISSIATVATLGIVLGAYLFYRHRQQIMPMQRDEEGEGIIADLYPVVVNVAQQIDIPNGEVEVLGTHHPEIY